MNLSVDNQDYAKSILIGSFRKRTRNEDRGRLRIIVCCYTSKLRSLHSREAAGRVSLDPAQRW